MVKAWTAAQAKALDAHVRRLAKSVRATEDHQQAVALRVTQECDPGDVASWQKKARRWLENTAKNERRTGARRAEIAAGGGARRNRPAAKARAAESPWEPVRRSDGAIEIGLSATYARWTEAADQSATRSIALKRELGRLADQVRELQKTAGVTPYLDDVVAEYARRIRAALKPEEDQTAQVALAERLIRDGRGADEIIDRAHRVGSAIIPFAEKLPAARAELQRAIASQSWDDLRDLLRKLGLGLMKGEKSSGIRMARARLRKRHTTA